jgi:hypothetical protein
MFIVGTDLEEKVADYFMTACADMRACLVIPTLEWERFGNLLFDTIVGCIRTADRNAAIGLRSF